MRRRRRNNDESLDLLLDTICNVFGGIIFIAMLVAILTSSQSELIRGDSLSAKAFIEEEPGADLGAIQNRVETLRISVSSIQSVLELTGGKEANEKAELLRTMTEAKAKAEERIEELEAWIKEFDETLESTKLDSQSKQSDLEEDIENLEEDLKQLVDASKIDARLPIARKTRLQQLIFAVKGGRLCWIPLGAAHSRFTADFQDQVDMQTTLGSTAIKPVTQFGIPITKIFETTEAFDILRGKSDPSQDFYDLYVWPDSVREVRLLRNILVKHGFSYQISTVAQGQDIILSSTDEALETQ